MKEVPMDVSCGPPAVHLSQLICHLRLGFSEGNDSYCTSKSAITARWSDNVESITGAATGVTSQP